MSTETPTLEQYRNEIITLAAKLEEATLARRLHLARAKSAEATLAQCERERGGYIETLRSFDQS